MSREYFSRTKNGLPVYLDTDTSHSVTHFSHNPKLRGIVEQIIGTINAKLDYERIETDTGEIIGTTDLVETAGEDEIVYALRPRRGIYSRFVKNKKPIPTSWVTVVLRREGDAYLLHTAFIGRNTPSFPGGEYLPEKAWDFWSKHALVWGTQEVVPGTETSICPWQR